MNVVFTLADDDGVVPIEYDLLYKYYICATKVLKRKVEALVAQQQHNAGSCNPSTQQEQMEGNGT